MDHNHHLHFLTSTHHPPLLSTPIRQQRKTTATRQLRKLDDLNNWLTTIRQRIVSTLNNDSLSPSPSPSPSPEHSPSHSPSHNLFHVSDPLSELFARNETEPHEKEHEKKNENAQPIISIDSDSDDEELVPPRVNDGRTVSGPTEEDVQVKLEMMEESIYEFPPKPTFHSYSKERATDASWTVVGEEEEELDMFGEIEQGEEVGEEEKGDEVDVEEEEELERADDEEEEKHSEELERGDDEESHLSAQRVTENQSKGNLDNLEYLRYRYMEESYNQQAKPSYQQQEEDEEEEEEEGDGSGGIYFQDENPQAYSQSARRYPEMSSSERGPYGAFDDEDEYAERSDLSGDERAFMSDSDGDWTVSNNLGRNSHLERVGLEKSGSRLREQALAPVICIDSDSEENEEDVEEEEEGTTAVKVGIEESKVQRYMRDDDDEDEEDIEFSDGSDTVNLPDRRRRVLSTTVRSVERDEESDDGISNEDDETMWSDEDENENQIDMRILPPDETDERDGRVNEENVRDEMKDGWSDDGKERRIVSEGRDRDEEKVIFQVNEEQGNDSDILVDSESEGEQVIQISRNTEDEVTETEQRRKSILDEYSDSDEDSVQSDRSGTSLSTGQSTEPNATFAPIDDAETRETTKVFEFTDSENEGDGSDRSATSLSTEQFTKAASRNVLPQHVSPEGTRGRRTLLESTDPDNESVRSVSSDRTGTSLSTEQSTDRNEKTLPHVPRQRSSLDVPGTDMTALCDYADSDAEDDEISIDAATDQPIEFSRPVVFHARREVTGVSDPEERDGTETPLDETVETMREPKPFELRWFDEPSKDDEDEEIRRNVPEQEFRNQENGSEKEDEREPDDEATETEIRESILLSAARAFPTTMDVETAVETIESVEERAQTNAFSTVHSIHVSEATGGLRMSENTEMMEIDGEENEGGDTKSSSFDIDVDMEDESNGMHEPRDVETVGIEEEEEEEVVEEESSMEKYQSDNVADRVFGTFESDTVDPSEERVSMEFKEDKTAEIVQEETSDYQNESLGSPEIETVDRSKVLNEIGNKDNVIEEEEKFAAEEDDPSELYFVQEFPGSSELDEVDPSCNPTVSKEPLVQVGGEGPSNEDISSAVREPTPSPEIDPRSGAEVSQEAREREDDTSMDEVREGMTGNTGEIKESDLLISDSRDGGRTEGGEMDLSEKIEEDDEDSSQEEEIKPTFENEKPVRDSETKVQSPSTQGQKSDQEESEELDDEENSRTDENPTVTVSSFVRVSDIEVNWRGGTSISMTTEHGNLEIEREETMQVDDDDVGSPGMMFDFNAENEENTWNAMETEVEENVQESVDESGNVSDEESVQNEEEMTNVYEILRVVEQGTTVEIETVDGLSGTTSDEMEAVEMDDGAEEDIVQHPFEERSTLVTDEEHVGRALQSPFAIKPDVSEIGDQGGDVERDDEVDRGLISETDAGSSPQTAPEKSAVYSETDSISERGEDQPQKAVVEEVEHDMDCEGREERAQGTVEEEGVEDVNRLEKDEELQDVSQKAVEEEVADDVMVVQKPGIGEDDLVENTNTHEEDSDQAKIAKETEAEDGQEVVVRQVESSTQELNTISDQALDEDDSEIADEGQVESSVLDASVEIARSDPVERDSADLQSKSIGTDQLGEETAGDGMDDPIITQPDTIDEESESSRVQDDADDEANDDVTIGDGCINEMDPTLSPVLGLKPHVHTSPSGNALHWNLPVLMHGVSEKNEAEATQDATSSISPIKSSGRRRQSLGQQMEIVVDSPSRTRSATGQKRQAAEQGIESPQVESGEEHDEYTPRKRTRSDRSVPSKRSRSHTPEPNATTRPVFSAGQNATETESETDSNIRVLRSRRISTVSPSPKKRWRSESSSPARRTRSSGTVIPASSSPQKSSTRGSSSLSSPGISKRTS